MVYPLGKVLYEDGMRHGLIQNGAAFKKPPHSKDWSFSGADDFFHAV